MKTGEKSISIVLTAPEKWKINPKDDPVSMQQIYSNLKYNVSVYNTKSRMVSPAGDGVCPLGLPFCAATSTGNSAASLPRRW